MPDCRFCCKDIAERDLDQLKKFTLEEVSDPYGINEVTPIWSTPKRVVFNSDE